MNFNKMTQFKEYKMKIILMLFSLISILFSAGFNCNKASTESEKKICSDDYLSKSDKELNLIYKELKNTLSREDFSIIKTSQIDWIKSRNLCKDQRSCLFDSYQNRNYLLKISYPLEIAIKKRDYTKIFHLSDKRGIRIASDGLILDPKYIKYLDSIEDIKYFFDRLFPKEIIEELKAGKHFEIYLFPEHNYPFRYRHRLSLGNNYSFLDDDGFIFDSHLVPIANFEQANMKYSEAQQYIRKDKELIKLENNLHMKKSLIKTASLSIKESDKIYETYSNTTNACIDKPEIKSCLRKVYMQNILDIESFIENRKKIFKIQNIKEVYNTIPKKFTISDRYYFTFQSPPLNEEKLAIELSNNPLTYFGTVLPNFKEHWVGRHNPTVQNVRELVHIFSLKDVIPDSNNGYYNAIIVKARGNKNKFLLAHVSDNSDPGGRIPDHMDPNYLNEFKFDLDENSEYVYVFEMAVIESQ